MLVFKFPAEDPCGQVCGTTHVFESWFQYYLFLTFSVFLITVMIIYKKIFVKFRVSKRKLMALQKLNEEDYSRTRIKFYQKFTFFRKKCKSDIPGLGLENIQTLQVSSVTNDHTNTFTFKDSLKLRKRRSSSILKSIVILASHVRAARYIFLIVAALFLTWTPYFSYVFYENILKLTQDTVWIGETELNITTILECLNNVSQEKLCNVTISVKNEIKTKHIIKNMIQFYKGNIMSIILSMFLSAVNSMANPILYAFWYPEFRQYLLILIPIWRR